MTNNFKLPHPCDAPEWTYIEQDITTYETDFERDTPNTPNTPGNQPLNGDTQNRLSYEEKQL